MLSDRDLHELAIAKSIVFPYVPKNCSGATIDLTLGIKATKYISDEPIILGDEIPDDRYREFDIQQTAFFLQPGESVLIHTHEIISVPSNLSARIYERYGVKALGLVISPAHYMNPGYRGNIGLLAFNTSSVPIRLVPGIKICQFALFELSSEPLAPYEKQDGKYMDAHSTSISKLHLDEDIQDFLKSKGVSRVSDELAKDLGDHLLNQIQKSAKKIADSIRNKEGLSH